MTWSQVVSVKAEDKPLTAYNLTVTGFHTYFVSGSNASNLDAASVHANIHNHFNSQRHLVDRQTYKTSRSTALAEWQNLMA